jgi:hypothetical protein
MEEAEGETARFLSGGCLHPRLILGYFSSWFKLAMGLKAL